jgi:hypothetical protein
MFFFFQRIMSWECGFDLRDVEGDCRNNYENFREIEWYNLFQLDNNNENKWISVMFVVMIQYLYLNSYFRAFD